MPARETDPVAVECLVTARLPAKDVRDWLQAEPGETTDFPADRRKFPRAGGLRKPSARPFLGHDARLGCWKRLLSIPAPGFPPCACSSSRTIATPPTI